MFRALLYFVVTNSHKSTSLLLETGRQLHFGAAGPILLAVSFWVSPPTRRRSLPGFRLILEAMGQIGMAVLGFFLGSLGTRRRPFVLRHEEFAPVPDCVRQATWRDTERDCEGGEPEHDQRPSTERQILPGGRLAKSGDLRRVPDRQTFVFNCSI